MYYMYTVVGIQNEYWFVDDINEYIDKLFVRMFSLAYMSDVLVGTCVCDQTLG